MLTLFRSRIRLIQFAALPIRHFKAGWRVGLVTTRRSGRWIVPKGWPKAGIPPHQLAAEEAKQEAGWVGEIEQEPIGSFCFDKRLHLLARAYCRVEVFVLRVTDELNSWPEAGQRRVQWFTPEEAATAVREPELAQLILKVARSRHWR